MKEFQMGEKSFFLFARLSRFTLNLFQLTFHHFFWRISRRDKQQTTQTFLKFLVKKNREYGDESKGVWDK